VSTVAILGVWVTLAALLLFPCWWLTGSLAAGLVLGYVGSWVVLVAAWVLWWVCVGSAVYARAEAKR